MCAACGIRIPPAGSFGPSLGSGSLSTDTRLGADTGNTGGAAGNILDWQKHPISFLLVIALAVLLARRVMK